MDKPVVIGLVGPTAGGKTALSLSLAAHHPIEIVCMDSMQVYRGMDIGTAKPTAAEQARIPHHMLDVADPAQPYSVAEYREGALVAIQGILDRGHMPVLVGGTGLYLRALSQGLTLGNTPRDDEVRGRYEEMLEVGGKQALHDHLCRVDPVSADRLHINDTRRVIRALEVWAVTGEPFSAQRVPEGEEPYRFLLYAPEWPREALYQRIDSRVDQMMAQGLLDEVGSLLRRGLTADMQSMQGLGYKELVPCLTEQADIGEALALIKRRTRNYAKRQLTWFRPDRRIRWLAPEGMEEALPQQVRLDMEEK
jgi:tRNA dimethylallyltransferase